MPLVVKNITCNSKKVSKPWITSAIKKSIKTKHKLYTKAVTSKYGQTETTKYRKYRNILTTVLKKAEKFYYAEQFSKYHSDSSKTWEIINDLIGNNRGKSKSQPDKLKLDVGGDTHICTKPGEITEAFNNFFVNIGSSLASKIDKTESNYSDYLSGSHSSSFFLLPTTIEEVSMLLRNMDLSKSPGYDNLPARLLSGAANSISKHLCHIFNLSFEQGKFPTALKVAKVTPLFKKGSTDIPGNYRPISVLPLISKILEKIVNKQLKYYLEKKGILYKHQYGFRSKYSTKLSLIHLINNLIHQIDSGKASIGIVIDFAKAFDTINHDILLRKMEHYGIRGLPNQWFENYLYDRSQFVYSTGISSQRLPILCGVPQGSVLGPTLFLLYINDLPNSTDFFEFRLFADDSNLFHSFPPGVCIDLCMVNTHLNDVVKWCQANKLTINCSKTNYIIFSGRRASPSVTGSLSIKTNVIDEVESATFVGIEIDKHLTWKNHISKINSIIRRKTGILLKLRRSIPRHILLLLYRSLIEPHITYGLEVWGSTYPSHLTSIHSAQKLIAKIVTFSDFSAPSSPLFKN